MDEETALRPSERWTGYGIGDEIELSDSGDAKRQSMAVTKEAGTVHYRSAGRSPRNEENACRACKILLARLREDGVEWEGFEAVGKRGNRQEGGLDCRVRVGGEPLGIQVTRAAYHAGHWKEQSDRARAGLAAQGEVAAVDADQIRAAIDLKLGIPERDRRTLLLAIDATDAPGLGLRTVVGSFRARYGAAVSDYGFRGIWIVGPTPDVTYRLDSRGSHGAEGAERAR